MADKEKEEIFEDVDEVIATNDSDDEDFQDALDDLVRASQAASRSSEMGSELSEQTQAKSSPYRLISNEDNQSQSRLNEDTEFGSRSVGEKSSTVEVHLQKSIDDLHLNKDSKDTASENFEEADDDEDKENSDKEDEDALLEKRKEREQSLSEEEIVKLKEESQKLKEEGNTLFRAEQLSEAIKAYTDGLEKCPLQFAKDRSIMYSNRAACMMHLGDKTAAIEDCTKALDLNPHYMKALLRRAELYDKTEKLDEALADYQRVLELDPRMHHAREACLRLPKQIEERNEKLKQEMMGKLKDLGNLILRPFGLSTENFKLQQDPTSGGYSVSFQQNQQRPQKPPEPTFFPPEDSTISSSNDKDSTDDGS